MVHIYMEDFLNEKIKAFQHFFFSEHELTAITRKLKSRNSKQIWGWYVKITVSRILLCMTNASGAIYCDFLTCI